MWHVSVGGDGDRAGRRLKAATLLVGVGDAAQGEWWEHSAIATHLRRRLTEEEAAMVGPVVDVRGTPEAKRRVASVQPYVNFELPEDR